MGQCGHCSIERTLENRPSHTMHQRYGELASMRCHRLDLVTRPQRQSLAFLRRYSDLTRRARDVKLVANMSISERTLIFLNSTTARASLLWRLEATNVWANDVYARARPAR